MEDKIDIMSLTKSELKDLAGLEVEDTIFFIADNETNANNFACQIRNELGKRLDLIDDSLFQFCWIVDFPMYELDDNGDLAFCHNPFSMPKGGLKALNTMNPLDITADQYDIVCNGIELSSGAVRNHDPEIMEKAFEIVGYGKDVIEEKFSALYNAFQFGAPPHAGIAPGVDRMIMLLTGSETIRDVIAFPMNSKAQDLLMGAPGNVTRAQLGLATTDQVVFAKTTAASGFWKESDGRLKSQVENLNHTLDQICNIPTVHFKMNGKYQVGTIAQSLEEIEPLLVSENTIPASQVPNQSRFETFVGEDGQEYVKVKVVEYEMLSVMALEGVKLLRKEFEDFKKQLNNK